jgi:hypothetical protein
MCAFYEWNTCAFCGPGNLTFVFSSIDLGSGEVQSS